MHRLMAPVLLTVSFAFVLSCNKTPTDSPVAGVTLTDPDGNVYTTVWIGNQLWTVENWRSTKYNDGAPIPHVPHVTELGGPTGWNDLTTGAYCYYNNDSTSAAEFGALYNWYAVETGKLAPEGWRVPTDDDWTVLENYLIENGYNWDGTTSENKIAKAMAAQTGWDICTVSGEPGGPFYPVIGVPGNNHDANNSSGFSGLPGGYRLAFGGGFTEQGSFGGWWSATESDASRAWTRYLDCRIEKSGRYNHLKRSGFSVRFVRDFEL